MTRAFLLMLLAIGGGWWNGFQRVYEANQAQQAGAAAYARRDFAAAARAFARARSLGNNSAQLHLNLGHAYARAGQAGAAREAYTQVLPQGPTELRSVARQQLATLAAAAGNYPQALALLRQALTDNPRNAAARYNYELLRPLQGRRLPPQLPPPPPPPSTSGAGQPSKPSSEGQAQPTPAVAGGTQAAGGGRRAPGQGTSESMAQGTAAGSVRGLDAGASSETSAGNAPASQVATAADNRLITRQRQPAPNLSEAQAEQVLEALRAAEQQYLQQIPYRSTRRADPRKPTW
ncbi:hypothetical protein GCM10027048_17500 [Hymenobacter coalescens]